MSNARFPVYRLLGGDICRQDVAGGRWERLSLLDAQELLALLDRYDHKTGRWTWNCDLFPPAPDDADLFHHPV